MLQTLPGNNKGFIFLEVLISVALVGLVLITLLAIGAKALAISASIEKNTKIDTLLREEMEAVRGFRDGSTWATNGLGTALTGPANPYYMLLNTASSPAVWELHPGAETVSGMTRTVIFDPVYRDGSGNIAASGSLDTNTIKATVTLAHNGADYYLMAYFTNWNEE